MQNSIFVHGGQSYVNNEVPSLWQMKAHPKSGAGINGPSTARTPRSKTNDQTAAKSDCILPDVGPAALSCAKSVDVDRGPVVPDFSPYSQCLADRIGESGSPLSKLPVKGYILGSGKVLRPVRLPKLTCAVNTDEQRLTQSTGKHSARANENTLRSNGFANRGRSKDRGFQDSKSDFQHGRRCSAETMGEVHLLLQRSEVAAGPPEDAKAFKNALRKKFGKLVYAWEAIDLNEDGHLQFHEFVRACRQMQFHGNFRKIFEEMTSGEETLRPDALDSSLPMELVKSPRGRPGDTSRSRSRDKPDAGPDFNHGRRCSAETMGEVHQLLQRSEASAGPPTDAKAFKNALIKKFGKLSYAWQELDLNEDGILQFHEFVRACRLMGFAGNFKKIFDDLTKGSTTLQPEALDPTLPYELKQLREKQGHDSPLSTSRRNLRNGTQEESSGPEYAHGRRCSASTMGEVHLLLQRTEAAAGPPADAKTFKNALLKKFGNFLTAWDAIDENNDGLLQYEEFVRACRKIQFGGNLKHIWSELTNGDNTMRPEALDPHLPSQIASCKSKSSTHEGFGHV